MRISFMSALAALAMLVVAECPAKEPSLGFGETPPSTRRARPVTPHVATARKPTGKRRPVTKAAVAITTLPFDIVAPGTYVLNQDLVASSGDYAIWIKSSDATLDCQGHSISTQSVTMAITGNEATGQGYTSVTIQNCVINGFMYGISTGNSGARHQVLNNAVQGSSYRSISVWGDDMLVKDNRVWNMRDKSGSRVVGIQVGYGYFGNTHKAQIIGNTIADIEGYRNATGIKVLANDDVTISGNAIMDVRISANTGFDPASVAASGIAPEDFDFAIDMVVENNVLMDSGRGLQANTPRPFGSLPSGTPVASLCAHNVFIGYQWDDTSMCAAVIGGSAIP